MNTYQYILLICLALMFYFQYVNFKRNKHLIKQIKFGNLLFTLNILFALIVLIFITFKITSWMALLGLLHLAIPVFYFNVRLLVAKNR